MQADVEVGLRAAERWPDPDADVLDRIVIDENRLRQLPGLIEMWRAGACLLHGDLAGTAAHARRALVLACDDDDLTRGGAATLLGLTCWGNGQLDEAYGYQAGLQLATPPGSPMLRGAADMHVGISSWLGTSTAPSSCCTRPGACTTATPPPRSAPSKRCRSGC